MFILFKYLRCSSVFSFDFRLNIAHCTKMKKSLMENFIFCAVAVQSSMLLLPIYVVRMIADYSFIHSLSLWSNTLKQFVGKRANAEFHKELVSVFQCL